MRPPFLRERPAPTFEFEDVQSYFRCDTEQAAAMLRDWVDNGWCREAGTKKDIIPRPPYCRRWYKVIKEKKAPVRKRVKETPDILPLLSLHDSIRPYYVQHPEKYYENQSDIVKLSDYLKNPDSVCITVNERSYMIFGREKTLDKNGKPEHIGYSIMQNCGLTYADLQCFRTVEPFHYYMLGEDGYGLVVENRDTWVSMKRAMTHTGNRCLFGYPIKCLVFGDGNRITRASGGEAGQESFTDFLQMEAIEDRVWLYAGDIDRKGISMAQGFHDRNPELDVRLFEPLYEAMIFKYAESGHEPEPSFDNLTRVYDTQLLGSIDPALRSEIMEHLELNHRLPQELMTYKDYMRILSQ